MKQTPPWRCHSRSFSDLRPSTDSVCNANDIEHPPISSITHQDWLCSNNGENQMQFQVVVIANTTLRKCYTDSCDGRGCSLATARWRAIDGAARTRIIRGGL